MAFCTSSTVLATILTSPPRLRLDIIDTPIGCTLPGSPAWHGFRFTTSDTSVGGVNVGCDPFYFPADGSHGGPPNVNFFSGTRVEVPICGIFIEATVAAIDQFDFTLIFFRVFVPTAGGGVGCDYTMFQNFGTNITLTGALGSGPGPLTFVVDGFPTHGVIGGVAPNLTYTPTADFFGTDTLVFHTFDGANSSALVTLHLCVVQDPKKIGGVLPDVPPGTPTDGCSEVFGPGNGTNV